MEPWWNPAKTLVEPSWNLTSGPPRPPRSLSGLRPQSFQLLGEKKTRMGVLETKHPQRINGSAMGEGPGGLAPLSCKGVFAEVRIPCIPDIDHHPWLDTSTKVYLFIWKQRKPSTGHLLLGGSFYSTGLFNYLEFHFC